MSTRTRTFSSRAGFWGKWRLGCTRSAGTWRTSPSRRSRASWVRSPPRCSRRCSGTTRPCGVDRKSVGEGKRVDLGGRRIIKKKKKRYGGEKRKYGAKRYNKKNNEVKHDNGEEHESTRN